jgi:hypothetical protein
MASQHLSLRVDPDTIKRLDRASRHEGTSRSDLAKTLIEEGLRMLAHPGIVFRPGPTGRRAALARGPDVWEVMNSFEDRADVKDEDIINAAMFLALSVTEIHDALGYYASYRDEIEERIRRNDEAFEEGYKEWTAKQGILTR